MKLLSFPIVLCAILAGVPGLGSAQETPQVIVDETFTDGELVGGVDEMDASWFEGSSSTSAIVDDTAGLASGNALQYLSTGNFSRVTGAFGGEVGLVSPGAKLTVEFRLRMTRFSEANEGGIRFGLHHDNGSPITAENAGENWTDLTDSWDGYYFRGGIGTAAGMRIYKDVPMVPEPSSPGAMGGSGDITLGNGTPWALGDMDIHSIRIEVLRTQNSQNLLRFYVDDELMQEVSTATAGGEMSRFTNFTIGTGGTEVDLLVDDLVVTLSTENLEPLEPIDLPDRLIDWTRAGVEGEIPDYENVIDFVDAGGDPRGQEDNSILLRGLIAGLTEDTVIYFPAGIYRFDRRIRFVDTVSRDLPGVIIRGAGTRETKLLFMDSAETDAGLFDVIGATLSADIPVTGGLVKGSTSITVESDPGFAVGDWLAIRQDNDFDVMATNRGISDYLESINNQTGYARRVVGQIVKIVAVDGNTISLDRPLHLDFTWANPTVTQIKMIEGIGFENFTLENGIGAAKRMNFDFYQAANCWIQSVHSLMAMRFHVGTELCANLTIRDSYFNDAWRHDGGGHGYGTLIADTTTHCLIENNVFRNLRHAMIWKEGANGNVFAYNYSTDGNQEGSDVAKDVSGHGHYAFANLIEGNIVEFIHASDYWGPIGPNNMFLRNRTTRERILIEDNTKDQNIIGNELVSPTSPFVIVDSSSTGAFVHGNNEGGQLQWRDDVAQSVVWSYYYTATPAFWDIPAPWPSMGPEYEAGTHTIPAKQRWDDGAMNEFVVPVPDIFIQPVGQATDVGDSIVLSVQSIDYGDVTYQWQKDGVDLVDGGNVSGATGAVLFISNATPADSGNYTLVITNERGSSTSEAALISIWSPDAGRLANLSTRGQVLPGNDIIIAGFVVGGTESKSLLVRGVGPTLAQFVGAEKALEDATIAVFSGPSQIFENDDWANRSDWEDLRNTMSRSGAFWLESDSKDAVVLEDFAPGAYSVHLAGKDGTGIGLVELYDRSPDNDSRLMNISTRGRVGTGDSIMVPGIVVTGNPRRLLVRGVGPELAVSFGLIESEVLADPVLILTNQAGEVLAENDNWSTGADATFIAALSVQLGAFALTEGSADAALYIEVPAGVYTAQVSGADEGEGIAIVEVYAAP